MFFSLALTAILFLAAPTNSADQVLDQTRVKSMTGTDVVVGTVREIEDSCIFENDFQFLRRLAWHESRDGALIEPFDWVAGKGRGGIWKNSDAALTTVQGSMASKKRDAVNKKLKVDVSALNYTGGDLEIPIKSGVVARAFIDVYASGDLPKTLDKQAEFWQSNINKNASMDASAFVSSMQTMPKCKPYGADLMFIIDSSGSIGAEPFEKQRNFVTSIVAALKLGDADYQIGIVEFSSNTSLLTSPAFMTDKSDLLSRARAMVYLSGGTSTHLGLEMALKEFERASRYANNKKTLYARIAILITDGEATDKDAAELAARQLKDAGVTLFTIGIGGIEGLDKMASNPTCLHYYSLATYENLATQFPDILQSRTCETSVAAPAGDKTTLIATLSYGQGVYIRYPVQIDRGITLKVSMESGEAVVYASLTVRLPSQAQHTWTVSATMDGETGELFISSDDLPKEASEALYDNQKLSDFKSMSSSNSKGRRRRSAAEEVDNAVTLFVSVTGLDEELPNKFKLQSDVGNTLTPTTMTTTPSTEAPTTTATTTATEAPTTSTTATSTVKVSKKTPKGTKDATTSTTTTLSPAAGKVADAAGAAFLHPSVLLLLIAAFFVRYTSIIH